MEANLNAKERNKEFPQTLHESLTIKSNAE